MKNKLFIIVIAVLLAALSSDAGHKVNNRYIPTSEDFSSMGGTERFVAYDSLFTELVRLMDTTARRDFLNVAGIITDTVQGNPLIDSLSGVKVVNGSGYIAVDSVTIGNAKVGATGTALVKIEVVDDTADTLKITVGEKVFSIVVDAAE